MCIYSSVQPGACRAQRGWYFWDPDISVLLLTVRIAEVGLREWKCLTGVQEPLEETCESIRGLAVTKLRRANP